MKNQEKDLQNENTGNTERKLTKEELTALCRRAKEHASEIRRVPMRMVEEERERAEQEKNQK